MRVLIPPSTWKAHTRSGLSSRVVCGSMILLSSSPADRLWTPIVILLLMVVSHVQSQEPDGQTHGFISFAVPRLVVEEEDGSQFTNVLVPLVRQIGSEGTVLATVGVSASACPILSSCITD